MIQNTLRHLLSQVVWLGMVGAVTFMLWASAVYALPGVEESGSAATTVPAPLIPGQSSVGPAEVATVTVIDPNSFPTSSPEEIATREATLNHTYLPGPTMQSPAGPEGNPIPNTETILPGGEKTVQSLIEKAPVQTGLAVTGSIAALFMLAKFLFGLALLLRGR